MSHTGICNLHARYIEKLYADPLVSGDYPQNEIKSTLILRVSYLCLEVKGGFKATVVLN